MAEFKTKYSIGDKVYYVLSEYANEDYVCPCCKGSGRIETNTGFHFACPECDGFGFKIRYGVAKNYVETGKVIEINIKVQKKKQENIYTVEVGSGTAKYNEEELTALEKEANELSGKKKKK